MIKTNHDSKAQIVKFSIIRMLLIVNLYISPVKVQRLKMVKVNLEISFEDLFL